MEQALEKEVLEQETHAKALQEQQRKREDAVRAAREKNRAAELCMKPCFAKCSVQDERGTQAEVEGVLLFFPPWCSFCGV